MRTLAVAARPRSTFLAAAIMVIAVAGLPGASVQPAAATEADLQQLPVTEPFQCLLCHVSEPAQTGSPLNPFGTDFLANLRTWDAALASLDSDGDGCTNGVELGDVDGDGQSDGNVDQLQSNPGAANDCGGASVDSRTWGELKSLFDRN